MKFGFDIHGVIDHHPKLFSKLSKMIYFEKHELHIITGSSITDSLKEKIKDWGIIYTHLFSITDYHTSIETCITYDSDNNPWMDKEIWNRTKGDYCLQHDIDFHIDDSDIYGSYFKTPYCRYYNINTKFKYKTEEWIINDPYFIFNKMLSFKKCPRCGIRGDHVCLPKIVDGLKGNKDFINLLKGQTIRRKKCEKCGGLKYNIIKRPNNHYICDDCFEGDL